MPKLHHWRLLWTYHDMAHLAARAVSGRRPGDEGLPIFTSPVVAGTVAQGQTVQTQNGSLYELGEALPADASCEFARSLIFSRITRSATKMGDTLTLEDLEGLDRALDYVLTGKRPPNPNPPE